MVRAQSLPLFFMPTQRHAAAHPSDHRLHLSTFKKASACFPCRARTSVPACERSNVRFVPQIILAARARTLEPCDFHLTLARLRMIDCGITSSIAAANAGVVQAACNVTAACARAFDAGRAGDHVGALDQAIARPEVDPLPKPSPRVHRPMSAWSASPKRPRSAPPAAH